MVGSSASRARSPYRTDIPRMTPSSALLPVPAHHTYLVCIAQRVGLKRFWGVVRGFDQRGAPVVRHRKVKGSAGPARRTGWPTRPSVVGVFGTVERMRRSRLDAGPPSSACSAPSNECGGPGWMRALRRRRVRHRQRMPRSRLDAGRLSPIRPAPETQSPRNRARRLARPDSSGTGPGHLATPAEYDGQHEMHVCDARIGDCDDRRVLRVRHSARHSRCCSHRHSSCERGPGQSAAGHEHGIHECSWSPGGCQGAHAVHDPAHEERAHEQQSAGLHLLLLGE